MERDAFGPWDEARGPRVWTREERAQYAYRPSCSICGTTPGHGVFEYGDIVTDVDDAGMIRKMVEDQPEMAETVLEASRRGGTILFLCHEECARRLHSEATA